MAYHAFRLTHLLNVAFYGLTMLHGLPRLLGSPKFWNYVIGPMIIFVIDQIMGMRQKYRKLNILNAELLPSDIIYLQFERPSSFDFRSGQWVRISSPTFSSVFNEWHAFSLASAPQSPTVELYIKAAGPWTWKLRSEILSSHADGSPYPLLHMAGPYGDGNQEWSSYEVAVMVGGGIGVTPYASTLTDLVLEITSARHHNVKCKKVYFLWICPTHKNYEWFVDVLKGVEELDQNRVIETHIFVTQLFHKFDLRTTMLYICEKHFRGDHQGKSMFTGLRAQNHFGRPNFDTFFSYLQSVHSEVRIRYQ
nr:FAD-binding 8 and Ferric reductase domain containing protein [Haemonchus contortus]